MGISAGVIGAAQCCRCPAKETVLPCSSQSQPSPDDAESVVEGEFKFKLSAGFDGALMTKPVNALIDFGMDPLQQDRKTLCSLYYHIILALGLQEHFAISGQTIFGYAEEVSLTYRDVRYHNFFHGFSVTQFLFTLAMVSSGVSSMLCKEDLLAVFVASLVHDGDHPGNNNAWEVATKSALAIRYNNEAVLENHHAAVGLRIMSMDRHNMFGTLSAERQEEVRKNYLHAILQTDMAKHSAMVEDLNVRISSGNKAFDSNLEGDRRKLVGVLLHSADISNPLLPNFSLCWTWGERIKEEFCNQFNQELERQLPPTQMWANLGTPVGFYKSQVGFIDFIVTPLWTSVLHVFPDLNESAGLAGVLRQNRDRWAYELKVLEERGTNKFDKL